MRCISDELIQKFIDNESSAKENFIVESHLLICRKCAEKVEDRRFEANRIKELIRSFNKNEILVPKFQEPENQRKSVNINIIKIAYVVSAACLIFLFILYHQKPKDEVDFVYSYAVESEFNANLPLSEQEMVFEIIDSEGKLIKY